MAARYHNSLGKCTQCPDNRGHCRQGTYLQFSSCGYRHSFQFAPRGIRLILFQERTSALEVGPKLYLTSLAISINTARPCPTDKWEEIKVSKHLRKEARSKEAKHLKAAGTWGPSLGTPIKWDEKQVKKQQTRRKKGEVYSGLDTQSRCSSDNA